MLDNINDQNIHQEVDWGKPVGKETSFCFRLRSKIQIEQSERTLYMFKSL